MSVVNNASATSGTQSITGLNAAGEVVGWGVGDIYLSFVTPGTLDPAATDSVSFYVGDVGGDIDNFFIRAYKLTDTLINLQFVSGVSFQPYTLNMPGVHRIEVDFLPPDDSGLGGYTLDDLQFNAPGDVPEPATMLLSGVALLALGVRRAWLQRAEAATRQQRT